MKKIIPLIVIAVSCLTSFGLGGCIQEPMYDTEIVFENSHDHPVKINMIDRASVKEFTLEKGYRRLVEIDNNTTWNEDCIYSCGSGNSHSLSNGVIYIY